MTLSIRRYQPRSFIGEIVQPAGKPVDPAYREIAEANIHLHKVLNALLKERSGQRLTEAEAALIAQHVVIKSWQLQHTIKE